MRFCRARSLSGFFLVGLLVFLGGCGDGEIVDPPPPAPADAVHLLLSEDVQMSGEGGLARLEVYSAGESSQLIVLLQTAEGITVTFRSPRGMLHPQKASYDLGESSTAKWSAQLTIFQNQERSDFWAESGFLNFTRVGEDRVDGDFQFLAQETDAEGQPLPQGRSVRAAGEFSAHVEHPGS